MTLKKYSDFINPRFLEIKIGDSIFDMEICTNHKIGLSKRESLDKDGMVFIFPISGNKSFHMKDCMISLDIVFCNKGEIVKIYKNCPPCNKSECKKYNCTDSDLVLEFMGGFCDSNGIKEGQFCQIL
jgi:uncharacterized membrane protein (UPF0127 family)